MSTAVRSAHSRPDLHTADVPPTYPFTFPHLPDADAAAFTYDVPIVPPPPAPILSTYIATNRTWFRQWAEAGALGRTPRSALAAMGISDFDTADTTDRKLRSPYGGMALDPAGRLWLTDSGNRRVLRFPTLMTESALDSALSADLGNDLNGNSEVDVGDEISYVLTLTNPDDESNAAVPSVRFLLIPPRESGLVIGSVTTSQGTIAVGNSNGDDSIDVRIGAIADSETVTITFTLKLGFEAVSPLRVQGTISSDLPGDLLSDDPALSGEDNPTEFAVNFAYRPATLTVIQVKPVKRPAAALRGLATNAVSVELKRKLSGPTHVFEVVGSSWRARLTGLRTGPNHFTVRALGKDGSYTAPLIITVRRLAHPRWR